MAPQSVATPQLIRRRMRYHSNPDKNTQLTIKAIGVPTRANAKIYTTAAYQGSLESRIGAVETIRMILYATGPLRLTAYLHWCVE